MERGGRSEHRSLLNSLLRRTFFRDLVTYGTLAAVLALVIGVAWISRNTDSPIIEAAERWPIVGGWAKSFRGKYNPPEPIVEEAQPEPEDVIVVLPNVAPFDANIEASRATLGGDPPLGSDPAPPRPLPARRADAARLDSALGAFSRGYEKRLLGTYVLYTDVEDTMLLEHLGRLASRLEESYERRYGLAPIGRPAESLLLFGSELEYRDSQSTMGRIRHLESEGYTGFGLAATYLGERHLSEVVTTLLHELIHLLNRRALGPALPPWLDEGMSDDLAFSIVDESGRLLPGTISGLRIETAGGFELRGGLASLKISAEDTERQILPALLDLSWSEFAIAGPIGLNYARAAFLVRCLLADRCGSGSAAAFRDYLSGISDGGAADPEALRSELDRSWAVVEADQRSYVRRLAQEHGLPTLTPLE